MKEHETLITQLYTGLENLDSEMMLRCYHEEATFVDPVFELHSKKEIDGMWSMLCSVAGLKSLSLALILLKLMSQPVQPTLRQNTFFRPPAEKCITKSMHTSGFRMD